MVIVLYGLFRPYSVHKTHVVIIMQLVQNGESEKNGGSRSFLRHFGKLDRAQRLHRKILFMSPHKYISWGDLSVLSVFN